jgi:hypothetical protein
MSRLIPTIEERQKIFYHLKKCSSYTAWSRILPYYQAWADILEKSVAEASDDATTDKPARLGTQELVFVLKGLSTFEKCLALLHEGDKSPFRYDGLNCFAVAKRPLSSWGEIWGRGELFRDVMEDPSLVPYWADILAAYQLTSSLCAEVGNDILQTPSPDDEAVFWFHEGLRDFFFNGKIYHNPHRNGEASPPHHFPGNLPDTPDPAEVVLIGYGDYVPYSGIWEPVKAEIPKRKLVSMFSKPDMPSGPFEVVGSMNYLHGHSTAPHIGEGREPIPTTWRLLWKDDRYLDGTIPAEETGYMFNEPRKISATANRSANVGDAVIFAQTGERAVKAGVWAVQEDLHARQTFAAGDMLPSHDHRNVTWVWSEA